MEERIENEVLTPLTDKNPEELANAIYEILDAKKGRDIKKIHVADKTSIAD